MTEQQMKRAHELEALIEEIKHRAEHWALFPFSESEVRLSDATAKLIRDAAVADYDAQLRVAKAEFEAL